MSNTFEHFKLLNMIEQGRNRYKLDNERWTCSDGHVAMGSSEAGKKLLLVRNVGKHLTLGSLHTSLSGFSNLVRELRMARYEDS